MEISWLLIYILQFQVCFSSTAKNVARKAGLPPSEVCQHPGLNPNPHDSCSSVYFDCKLSSDGMSWNETIKHCDSYLYFNPDPSYNQCTTADKVNECHVEILRCPRKQVTVEAGTLVCPGDLANSSQKVGPGEMCRLECDLGLISTGPTTTSCTSTGWTITAFQCVGAVAVIFGGMNDDGNLADVEVYHPNGGSCGNLPPLPYPNNRMVAEWVNGKLVVCGGRLVDGTKDVCWEYNPSGKDWEQHSRMTQVRRDCGSVAMDDDLWMLGGWNQLESSEIFDRDGANWRPGPPLPQARKDQCALRIGAREFMMLGGQSNDFYVNTAAIFSTETQTWRSHGKLGEARVNLACGRVEIHNQTMVVVAGGFGGLDGSLPSRRNTAELFDPSTGTSVKVGNMQSVRDETAMAVVDGAAIIFGGYTGDVTLASVERYNSETKMWEVLPNMATARRHHAAVAVPKTLVPICNNVNQ